MNGFDDIYAPGYFEDADYCMRLRKVRYRTVYAPNCVRFHYEYASSSDGNAADLIQNNRATFVSRHRSVLIQRSPCTPSGIINARDRSHTTQRTLYFEDFLPPVPTNNEFTKAAEMRNSLAIKGHFVTVFASVPEPFHWEDIRRAVANSIEVIPDIGWPQIGNFIAGRRGYYDVVIVNSQENTARFKAMAPSDIRNQLRVITTSTECLTSLRL